MLSVFRISPLYVWIWQPRIYQLSGHPEEESSSKSKVTVAHSSQQIPLCKLGLKVTYPEWNRHRLIKVIQKANYTKTAGGIKGTERKFQQQHFLIHLEANLLFLFEMKSLPWWKQAVKRKCYTKTCNTALHLIWFIDGTHNKHLSRGIRAWILSKSICNFPQIINSNSLRFIV